MFISSKELLHGSTFYYVLYSNYDVRIIHITNVRLIDLCWIVLFLCYDGCLL